MRRLPIQWTIVHVTAIHLIWASLLFISGAPLHTNPLGFFETFAAQKTIAFIFLIAGLLAICSFKIKDLFTKFFFLLPQQILLLLTSFSGILSAIRGHYMDGVVRPGIFIFADQLPIILLSIIYGLAIYETVMIDNK